MRSLSRSKQAFTLVEILVVVSLMVLLAVLTAPALPGLISSGRMNQNLLQLSGLLEQGRQYAIAQNTYVWVVFLPGTDSTGVKTLSVAALASKDGTDPASPSSWTSFNYGVAPNNQFELISKVSTFRQISLSDAGTFGTSVMPSLPATPTPVSSSANSAANNPSGFFTLQIPGSSGTQVFTKAIQFTPQGEARNGSSPINLVELDWQPQKGNNAVLDPNNIAVTRVNGLTGESVIYRR